MSDKPIVTAGPYSPIREAGGLYFVSGQIGVDASMTADADVSAQTRQTIANLERVLDSAGLTLQNVVKATVFLTDMGDFAAVNKVYLEHFEAPRPARSCIAVAELPRVANVPLKVEIEAIAVKV